MFVEKHKHTENYPPQQNIIRSIASIFHNISLELNNEVMNMEPNESV